MASPWSLKHRVRRGHRGDAPAVLKIFRAALREHGFADAQNNVNVEIADFGAGKDSTRDELVAVSGGKVCGFLILGPTTQTGCGELLKVFVEPSQRRRGIGTLLIQQCLEVAKERGYRELMLETHTAFATGRRYYERHGWSLLPHWSAEESTTRVYSMKLLGFRAEQTG